MKTINRKNCILYESEIEMEHLYTFKNFPVFMGCVDNPDSEQDILSDMRWEISKKSGMIQLASLLPIDIVYSQAHGSGLVGSMWKQHHSEFADFVIDKIPNQADVLEIGAQHGILADNVLSKNEDVKHWTIIEPNPNMIESLSSHSNVSVYKGWFNEKFIPYKSFNTIIHSHVFEHVLDPHLFMRLISNRLNDNQRCIFSVPNMKAMLERGYVNCLNFEHTFYLSEDYIEYFAEKYSFSIIDKKYFKEDHSIFYCIEKIDNIPTREPTLRKNIFQDNLNIFNSYCTNLINEVSTINTAIVDEQEVYIFGGHVFSQYLISLGLDCNNIINILDNDPNKHGKRLYGTNQIVTSPEQLRDKVSPLVILKAGVYTNEIKKQITDEINSSVRFIL